MTDDLTQQKAEENLRFFLDLTQQITEEILDPITDELEQYFGTAWGEDEWALRRRLIAVIAEKVAAAIVVQRSIGD